MCATQVLPTRVGPLRSDIKGMELPPANILIPLKRQLIALQLKNVRGKVVAQSIAFQVVSIYWQGDDPFPLKSWLQVTYPLMKAASFDTFCLVAVQPLEIEKEVQLHLTRTRHGLSNEPSIKVLTSSKWG